MPLESKIQSRIIKFLEKQQWVVVFKQTVSNKPWVPDLLCVVWEGKHFWIETKQENGGLSELQKYRIKQLEDMWDKVLVVYSFDDFIEQFMWLTI